MSRRCRSALLIGLVVLLMTACSSSSPPVRLATECRPRPAEPGCPVFRQAFTADDAAPLPRGSVIVSFTQPVRVPDARAAVRIETPAVDLESGEAVTRSVPVRGIKGNGDSPRHVTVEVDGLLADGATIELPDGTIRDERGKPAGAWTVTLHTGISPLALSLAGVRWEPAEERLYSPDGTVAPKGSHDDGAVRAELEQHLRLRPGITDAQVQDVLARYDGDAARRKLPDPRLRAGLLLLTDTSAEAAVNYLLSDTNRVGVPFAPVEVRPIADLGVFAAVFYDLAARRLRMVVDTGMASDSLENIAVMLSHETLHSSLGAPSAAQETLAMAMETRIYEEFLLWDPDLVLAPTDFTRQQNILTLMLRNSGRFGFPKAGILPRADQSLPTGPGSHLPATSFKDLLFRPDFYGDLRPSGDVGSEVVEAYYQRLAGERRTRLAFDDVTLKLFDEVLDNGFSDEQIMAILRALRLRPVSLAPAP